MKIRNDNAPESNGSHGFIRATLAIPENAVRMIAALPETITQRNVEAVTGLPVRTFLELIRSPGFPLRVHHIGKLRVVNRVAFVQWLEAGEPKQERVDMLAPHANDATSAENSKGTINGTNELLTSVGLRERAPKRRPRRKR